MTYELLIGDYAYSSWSLRGWLLLDRFDLPYRTRMIDFSAAPVAEQLADIAPARTVPVLLCPDGAVVPDTLAITEELADRHPECGIWPAAPRARAAARALVAEMHSAFEALRGECPMNLRTSYTGVAVSDAVKADLARIEALWDHARREAEEEGPWLFGAYCAADAFFAPVAARIAGYDLPVGAEAAAYVTAHLHDPAFRRWRAMGLASGQELERYRRDYDTRPWPGPRPRPASAVDSGTPENEICPYSGKEPTHLLESQGRIFGFCNAFCRDKTLADPGAWPGFVKLI